MLKARHSFIWDSQLVATINSQSFDSIEAHYSEPAVKTNFKLRKLVEFEPEIFVSVAKP